MGPLRNARHEKFAQNVAKGNSATQALKAAGYRSGHTNVGKFMSNYAIRARIAELQAQQEENLLITREFLLAKAEAARAGAMGAQQFSAAVSAVKELGILSGHRIERTEQGQPGEFDGLSAQEFAEAVHARVAALGLVQTKH